MQLNLHAHNILILKGVRGIIGSKVVFWRGCDSENFQSLYHYCNIFIGKDLNGIISNQTSTD